MIQSQNLTFPSINSLLAWAGVHDYRSVKLGKGKKWLTQLILAVQKDDSVYYFKQDGDTFTLIATSSKDVFEEKKEEA